MAFGVALPREEEVVAALQGIKWTAEVKRGIKAIYVTKHHQAETANLEEKEMGQDKTECHISASPHGQEPCGHVPCMAEGWEMAPSPLASHQSQ